MAWARDVHSLLCSRFGRRLCDVRVLISHCHAGLLHRFHLLVSTGPDALFESLVPCLLDQSFDVFSSGREVVLNRCSPASENPLSRRPDLDFVATTCTNRHTIFLRWACQTKQ